MEKLAIRILLLPVFLMAMVVMGLGMLVCIIGMPFAFLLGNVTINGKKM